MIPFKSLSQFKGFFPYLLFALLFIYYMNLAGQVNFMQNDDWYYYAQVEQFLKGDFSLLPKIAPTFYMQGFMGAVFASIFGISKLPYLTILVGFASLLLIYNIVYLISKSYLISVITALLIFLFPLNQIALIGFMTESYFIFFALLSLFFATKFEQKPKSIYQYLTTIFYTFSFFVRQVGLVFPLGFSFYYLLKKNYKTALVHILFFILTFIFYYAFFPKTEEMTSKGMNIIKGEEGFYYYYSVFIGLIIYLVAFSIPVILTSLSQVKKFNLKTFAILIVISIGLYYGNSRIFNGDTLPWGEFPYFDNTFERTGFVPREFHGTKYHFKGMFDLYHYWELAAGILVATFFAYLITFKNKKSLFTNKTLIMGGVYVVVLYFSYYLWDRYLILLFLLFVIGMIQLSKPNPKVMSIVGIPFVVFLFFFNHLLLNDFIGLRNYTWKKSRELTQNGVDAKLIKANTAWNKKSKSFGKTIYMFSYDSQQVNSDYREKYELLDTYTPHFRGNIFVNPKLYLYKLKPGF